MTGKSNRVEIIGNERRGCVAIYALCEYPSLEPRYIGKTVQYLNKRHKAHISSAKRNLYPVHRWISKQIANGNRLVIKLIEYVSDKDDWAARERYWIKNLRETGRCLNLTDGGEGLHGHEFSDDHRSKISNALKTGEFITCEQCGEKAWRKLCEIKKGDCRFCSRECYQKSLKGISKSMPEGATQKGISAAAIKKLSMTHCKRGHLLSGENVFKTSGGGRGCKECRKIHKGKYRAKLS